MAFQFPKRILEEGAEPQIDKINNTCRRSLLDDVKAALQDEYEEVLKDPVFGPLLAIIDNQLIYSGKIIHSFICKQLKVSKLHELWFLFAKRPLRFSAQEFHAVTGLKFKEEPDIDFNDWKDDKGFWAQVLRKNRKVNLFAVRTKHLKECKQWSYVDRIRLVYLCIIHGFLVARDSRVYIPHEYIRMVMDFEKMRMFPWGLHAYDVLVESVIKARTYVHLKNSYVLDGFSYALQIWIMEAIPDIGSLVGKKIRKNMTKVRCRNWKGSGKVSYTDIISLESHFNKGELFPFISATGNNDVIFNQEFVREDEKKDERISRVVALITAKQDWSEFVWEVEALPRHGELSDSEEDGENVGVDVEHVTDTHVDEAPVVARMGKRLVNDPGVESRKKQLLCQRAAEHSSGISNEVKTFIEGLFTSAFNSFKEVVQKDIHHRFDKVEKEMAQLNQVVSQIRGPSEMVEKERASIIPCPSSSIGKDQEKSSQSPSAAKKKGKGKVDEVVVPPIARRSPRQARKEFETDDMMDFLKKLSQRSNTHGEPPSKNEEMGTQEDLLDAMGNLSQASYVDGFDLSQRISGEEAAEWVTPLRSFKPAGWKTPTLKYIELPEDRMNDVDYSLVFLPEDLWAKLIEWCSTSKQQLRIGPSIFNKELAERVMGPAMWLKNYEIDAMLYLFREKTTLQRLNQSKVAFMSCLFRLMWDLDVNRMYVPLLVHGNRWISMCVSFVTRSIEVFDFAGMKHPKDMEPFTHLIPRIVKAVQSSQKKGFTVKPYTVTYAPMPFLNKTSSDCGVYALKHIF
ncbi:hypothetical protein Bca101_018156 [Brassica carinata]